MEQQNIYDNKEFFKGYQSLSGFKLEHMGESYATDEIIRLKPKYAEQKDYSFYVYFKCKK